MALLHVAKKLTSLFFTITSAADFREMFLFQLSLQSISEFNSEKVMKIDPQLLSYCKKQKSTFLRHYIYISYNNNI